MKRICFLVDSIFSFGGVQRVTAVIAKELAVDYDVTIVTLDNPADKDITMYGLGEAPLSYRFFSYPKGYAVETLLCKAYSLLYRKVLPQTRLTSYIYGLSSLTSRQRRALARELRGGDYDVIIGVHAPLAVRLATIRGRLGRARVYGWIHNSYDAMFAAGSPYAGPELARHFALQYRRLDKVVMLCGCDVERYDEETRTACEVIPNPLTLVPGKPSDGHSRSFLAVGRFSHRHKGFDLLIKAFNLFAKSNGDWTLDIVGEGPEEAMLRGLINRYGLERRVRLHPFTRNIQEYYSRAAVYVLSSRWEGFGLVMVEAMAHGLPVISSDLPSSKEILGGFGMYFENGNIDGLATRLTEATRIDWPEKSAEAMRIARRYDVKHCISLWKEKIIERDADT